jgi:hypothetical protein
MLLRGDHILKKEKMPAHLGLQREVHAIVEVNFAGRVGKTPTRKVVQSPLDL